MLQTLLGREGFRRGMDLYFQRHDGQAVTTDDFVSAMEDANGAALRQFRLWYSQAGPPELRVSGRYDPIARTYTLDIHQSCPPTPGQTHKLPFHIPLVIGLLDPEGHNLPLQLAGETEPTGTQRVLELRESEHRFTFINVPTVPKPSLLRGFSAPVKLLMDYSDEDLMFLLAHDSDEFNCWEAAQKLALRTILQLLDDRRQSTAWTLPEAFSGAFSQVLNKPNLDPALLDQVLNLPDEAYLAEQMEAIDVDGIHEARNFVRRALAQVLQKQFLAIYETNHDSGGHCIDAAAIGRRSLKNRCLDYLMQLQEPFARELCYKQYQGADNMTDQLSALGMLANCDCPERGEALVAFHERWKDEPLVLDKWFTLQATSQLPGTLTEVKGLLHHPAFSIKNPNKVRALIGAFCQSNPVRFHQADGAGYEFLTGQVLILNAINPQMAARLLTAFTRWRKYDVNRQYFMRSQLERILQSPALSPDVYEIVSKSLGKENHLKC
jgi:aminopeptidase N